MASRLLSLTACVALFLLGGAAVAEAHSETIRLRIVGDPSTFDSARANGGPGEAFFISGTICADRTPGNPCVSAGTFLCWGWRTQSGGDGNISVVTQEFNITGRGKIVAVGVEDPGPRAVTGGTGDFRNVRGQIRSTDFSAFPEFVVRFNLTGTRRAIE